MSVKKRSYVNRMRQVLCLGIFLALTAAFCMSTAVALVKLTEDIHPIEILIIRSVMQLVVFVVLAVSKDAPLLCDTNERWHLCGRSLTGAINQGCLYLSVRLIPLMDTTAIDYGAPIFVVILAFIFLKEPFGIFEGFSVSITLIGVLLITRPTFIPIFNNEILMTTKTIEGLIMAIFASFTFALSNIHIRKLQKTATEVVAIWFSLLSIAIGIPLLFIFDRFKSPQDMKQISCILLSGFCAIFGLVAFSLALKIEKAAPVSVAQSCTIVICLIYQLALFHEPLSTSRLIGACLIGSSVVLISMKDILLNSHVNHYIRQSEKNNFMESRSSRH